MEVSNVVSLQDRLPHYHVVVVYNGTDRLNFYDPMSSDFANGFIAGLIASKPTRRNGDIRAIWLVETTEKDCPLAHDHDNTPDFDAENVFLSDAMSREPIWELSA
ncbi:hypothetical protein [Mycobacterium intracellulare]|uniref:hypothetical protein n=1 Tax=Mycobacterium intracellulare TaxID=1767 RepID=UPI0034D2C2A6